MKNRNLLTLVIGIVLVGIFALLLLFFQVRVSEKAVVTTFGKPTRSIENAGLYFKLPPPIQKVYKFDKRIQTFEDKFTEDLTGDGNTLMTTVFVGWSITDPGVFFPRFAGGSIIEAEKTLESLVRSEKSAAVSKHAMSDFVNADEKALKFDQIEKEIRDNVQARLEASQYGMKIEFLGFKKLGLPESVTQEVFNRMTSNRKKLASEYENSGEAEARRIRGDGDGKAAALLTVADGEAKRIRSEGEKAAAETLHTFEQNPDLHIFLLSMDSLEQSLKERATIVIDQRTPPFNYLEWLDKKAPTQTKTGK
jgi:membrane protease subunit HflC